MYTLVKAYGVKKSLNSMWENHDVSSLKIFELFQTFRELYLELTNTFITGPLYVNLKDLESSYISSSLTLEQLFLSEPTLNLQTIPSVPKYEQKKIMYMDAFRAGYKVDITAPGHSPTSNFSSILKTELAIRRDATSNKDLHEFCLFTVNGFLHQTDYDDNYLYVLDGGKSLQKSRRNNCGITSFERIAKIHKKQITTANISLVENNIPLSRQVLITAPTEFRNKTLMLSIGGYLVTPHPNVFKRISDDLWILNTEQLDLVAKYFESSKYLDLSSLELTQFPKDPNKISLIELQSNEVMLKYLTLSQSFFIAVDVEQLSFIKQFVRHSPIANEFISFSNPTAPLFLGRGRQADYWKQQDENYWQITVENSFRPRLTYDTVDTNTRVIDSGNNPPYHIYDNSRAFLLDIIADVRVS